MNAAVNKKHYMLVLGQTEMMLEQIMEQYGSWLLLAKNDVNLDARGTMQQIYEMANGVATDNRKRAAPRCKITDEFADAVKELLDDIKDTDSEVVREWIRCIELYYIDFYRQIDVARIMGMSETAVSECIKCGIAHICARRSSVKSFFTTKVRSKH